MVASPCAVFKRLAAALPRSCNRLRLFLNPIAFFPVALSPHPRYKIDWPQAHKEIAMAQKYVDSFGTRKTLTAGSQSYDIFRLDLLEKSGLKNVSKLPVSLKVLL